MLGKAPVEETAPTRAVQVDAPEADRFNTRPFCGQVAQSVEQRTENPRVGSSILPLATIPINVLCHVVVISRTRPV